MAKKGTIDEERPMVKMGTIDFRYDEVHDLIVATPHWNIETKEDVLLWFRQYEAYMRAFDRKMDFVVVLDDFTIGPAIGPFWGEYRAKVHQTRAFKVIELIDRIRHAANDTRGLEPIVNASPPAPPVAPSLCWLLALARRGRHGVGEEG